MKQTPPEQWDWSEQSGVLAKRHGYSVSAVSNLRRRLGKAKSTKHYPECLQWDWSQPAAVIATTNNVSLAVVYSYANRLKLKLAKKSNQRRQHRREEALKLKHIGLTYAQIGRIWGISSQAIVSLINPPIKAKVGECSECKKPRKLQRHHITYVPEVVELICRPCHRAKHKKKG
jgi:5-methylcytosine-specific restriction endonuclease McrA